MSLKAHLESLERKRDELKAKLEDYLAHPSTDDLAIAELKRQKLLLKDEITKIQTNMEAA